MVGFMATKNDPPRVVRSSGAGCSSAYARRLPPRSVRQSHQVRGARDIEASVDARRARRQAAGAGVVDVRPSSRRRHTAIDAEVERERAPIGSSPLLISNDADVDVLEVDDRPADRDVAGLDPVSRAPPPVGSSSPGRRARSPSPRRRLVDARLPPPAVRRRRGEFLSDPERSPDGRDEPVAELDRPPLLRLGVHRRAPCRRARPRSAPRPPCCRPTAGARGRRCRAPPSAG